MITGDTILKTQKNGNQEKRLFDTEQQVRKDKVLTAFFAGLLPVTVKSTSIPDSMESKRTIPIYY